MAKMCRYFKTISAFGLSGGILKTMECKKVWSKEWDTCPKNTNPKCQIITKRPKYRKVRGYVSKVNKTILDVGLQKWDTDRHITLVTCVILIDEKHFKGEK